jgi:hypothetical protein
MNCNGQKGNQHQGGPTQDTPGKDSGDFGRHELEKIVAGGEGKKYPARQYEVRVAHKKQSETRYIYKFCVVLHHKGSCFEKHHSNRNNYILYTQFLQ